MKSNLGCGSYVEEEVENGLIGFVCGDYYKGICKICKKCKEKKK